MKTQTISIRDCTQAFAVPGEDSLIDCINPVTGRSWIAGEDLDQIRKRYPKAEIVEIENFCAQKHERQSTPIEWTETTEERYWNMLECVPPATMCKGAFLVGEAADHCAKTGRPRFQAYYQQGRKYFEANRPMTFNEFQGLFNGRYATATFCYS